mgnify:FL=1
MSYAENGKFNPADSDIMNYAEGGKINPADSNLSPDYHLQDFRSVCSLHISITRSAPNYCIAPVFPALFSDGRPTLSNLSKIQYNIKRFFL